MNAKKYDVIKGIVGLYLSGIITGYFANSEDFMLEGIKKESSSNSTILDAWERIILGALISEQVLSWPKIAALLAVDRETAREKAYSFISRGISTAIARDTVLVLSKIPQLPPLVQIVDLKIQDQQLLGVLILKGKISIKEISNLFNLSNIEVYRKVYFLIGSGLVVAKRNKTTFIISKSQSFEPNIPVNELAEIYQRLITIIESEKSSLIPINRLAKQLDINKKSIIKLIGFLVARGYYIGSLQGKYFNKKRELFRVKGKPLCFECGTELDDYKKACPACEAVPPICSVCRGALSTTDFIVACPYCQNQAHTTHISEWLKIKGECPMCKNKLRANQLITIDQSS